MQLGMVIGCHCGWLWRTRLAWIDVWQFFPVNSKLQGDLCRIFKIGECHIWSKMEGEGFGDWSSGDDFG